MSKLSPQMISLEIEDIPNELGAQSHSLGGNINESAASSVLDPTDLLDSNVDTRTPTSVMSVDNSKPLQHVPSFMLPDSEQRKSAPEAPTNGSQLQSSSTLSRRALFRWFVRYVSITWGSSRWVLASILYQALFEMTKPLLLELVFNAASEDGDGDKDVSGSGATADDDGSSTGLSATQRIIIGSVALTVAHIGLFQWKYWYSTRIPSGNEANTAMREVIIKHSLSLPHESLGRMDKSRIMSLIVVDVDQISLAASRLFTCLSDSTRGIAVLVTLFLLSWQLALVVTAFVPVLFWLSSADAGPISEHTRAYRYQEKSLISQCDEVLDMHSVEKSLDLHAHTTNLITKTSKPCLDAAIKLEKVLARSSRRLDAVSFGCVVAIIIIGGVLVKLGELELGSFIGFFFAADSALSLVCNFAKNLSGVHGTGVSVGKVQSFQSLSRESFGTNVATGERNLQLGFQLKKLQYAVPSVKHGQRLLCDIDSLSLPLGETIGVVGKSGAGKTTLLKLLTRLYTPTKGKILLGGTPLHEWQSLVSMVAVMEQDVKLYSTTILDNIRVGLPDCSDAQVRRVCQLVCLDDDIENMDDGYHTNVGRGGVTMSTGQRQRVALARCLVRDTPIVFLDEPLSAQDPTICARVAQNLRQLQRTNGQPVLVIMVTHNLASILGYDKVLVIDEGQIKEFGPTSELLAAKGRFWSMTNSQDGIEFDRCGRAMITAKRLQQVWLFAFCTYEDVEYVSKLFSARMLQPGEVLLREGAPATSCYVVAQGSMSAVSADELLKEEVVVGQSYRELDAVTDDALSDVTITATTMAIVLSLDAQILKNIMQSRHSVGRDVTAIVQARTVALSPANLAIMWPLAKLSTSRLQKLATRFTTECLVEDTKIDEDAFIIVLSGRVQIETTSRVDKSATAERSSSELYRDADYEAPQPIIIGQGQQCGEDVLTGTFDSSVVYRVVEAAVLLILRRSAFEAFCDADSDASKAIEEMVAMEAQARSFESLSNNWLFATALSDTGLGGSGEVCCQRRGVESLFKLLGSLFQVLPLRSEAPLPEASRTMAIVLSGSVEVSFSYDGIDYMTSVENGGMFGETGLFHNETVTNGGVVSAEATIPCVLLILRKDVLDMAMRTSLPHQERQSKIQILQAEQLAQVQAPITPSSRSSPALLSDPAIGWHIHSPSQRSDNTTLGRHGSMRDSRPPALHTLAELQDHSQQAGAGGGGEYSEIAQRENVMMRLATIVEKFENIMTRSAILSFLCACGVEAAVRVVSDSPRGGEQQGTPLVKMVMQSARKVVVVPRQTFPLSSTPSGPPSSHRGFALVVGSAEVVTAHCDDGITIVQERNTFSLLPSPSFPTNLTHPAGTSATANGNETCLSLWFDLAMVSPKALMEMEEEEASAAERQRQRKLARENIRDLVDQIHRVETLVGRNRTKFIIPFAGIPQPLSPRNMSSPRDRTESSQTDHAAVEKPTPRAGLALIIDDGPLAMKSIYRDQRMDAQGIETGSQRQDEDVFLLKKQASQSELMPVDLASVPVAQLPAHLENLLAEVQRDCDERRALLLERRCQAYDLEKSFRGGIGDGFCAVPGIAFKDGVPVVAEHERVNDEVLQQASLRVTEAKAECLYRRRVIADWLAEIQQMKWVTTEIEIPDCDFTDLPLPSEDDNMVPDDMTLDRVRKALVALWTAHTRITVVDEMTAASLATFNASGSGVAQTWSTSAIGNWSTPTPVTARSISDHISALQEVAVAEQDEIDVPPPHQPSSLPHRPGAALTAAGTATMEAAAIDAQHFGLKSNTATANNTKANVTSNDAKHSTNSSARLPPHPAVSRSPNVRFGRMSTTVDGQSNDTASAMTVHQQVTAARQELQARIEPEITGLQEQSASEQRALGLVASLSFVEGYGGDDQTGERDGTAVPVVMAPSLIPMTTESLHWLRRECALLKDVRKVFEANRSEAQKYNFVSLKEIGRMQSLLGEEGNARKESEAKVVFLSDEVQRLQKVIDDMELTITTVKSMGAVDVVDIVDVERSLAPVAIGKDVDVVASMELLIARLYTTTDKLKQSNADAKELRSALAASQQNVVDLQTKADADHNEIDRLVTKLAALEADHRRVVAMDGDVRAQKSDIEAKLAQVAEETEQAWGIIDEERAKVHDAVTTLRGVQTENAHLHGQLEGRASEMVYVRAEMKRQVAAQQELYDRKIAVSNQEHEKELQMLRVTLSETTTAARVLESEIAELKAKMDRNSEKHAAELQTLKATFRKAHTENAIARGHDATVGSPSTNRDLQERRHIELEREVASLRRQLQEKDKLMQDLRNISQQGFDLEF